MNGFINESFSPIPPPVYGTPHQYLRGDSPANRSSVGIPGVGTGLYHPYGPIDIRPSFGANMLTNIKVEPKLSLNIELQYTNKSLNTSIIIEPGKLYSVMYIEDGVIKQCAGRLSNIYRVDTLDPKERIYKLNFDCSVEYSNMVVTIKSDQIRYIQDYIPYVFEDHSIDNSEHRYGSTSAEAIEEVVIEDAIIDESNNIIMGTIVSGLITKGITVDGIACGVNKANHKIYLKHAKTFGGDLKDGKIIHGTLQTGNVINGSIQKNGITMNAKITGTIRNATITGSVVIGGKTRDGKIFNPVITKPVIKDAIITGRDMITVDGITNGNITTGGTTYNGEITGGIASGIIGGGYYTITNPVIKPSGGKISIVTTGGTVTGGEITGGEQVGELFIGTRVIGGVLNGGTSITEGITVEPGPTSELIPVKPSDVTLGIVEDVIPDDDTGALPEDILKEYPNYDTLEEIKQTHSYEELTKKYHKTLLDGLLIGYDKANANKFWTNFGVWEAKEVNHIVTDE